MRKCNKKGFTLAETLITILIFLMISGLVATGIPTAVSAYQKVIFSSNAEILLSTTITSLRNELGVAKNITVKNNEIFYYNEMNDTMSKIYMDMDNDVNTIMCSHGINTDQINKNRLINVKTSTNELYVMYDSVTQENDLIVFTNLQVYRKDNHTPVTGRDTFSVKLI